MSSGEGIEFEDIPFSEIESRLFVAIHVWKNFDDLEDNLILDELILLNDAVFKKEKESLKINAAIHGHELDDDEDEVSELEGDLDPEILEMERKYLEKHANDKQNNLNEFSSIGLGFSTA